VRLARCLVVTSADDEARPTWKRALDLLLPLLVLGLGAVAIWALVSTAPRAERASAQEPAPMVRTVVVERFEGTPVVEATGTVRAVRRAEVAPRVRGPVVWRSPELRAGGRLREGEALLRVDPTDFRLAVAERRARVAEAELAATRAESERTVSRRTWDDLGAPDEGATEGGVSLALREPQVDSARERVDAARAALRRARLNVSRTELDAPFDAVVEGARVDEGQVVGPEAPVATLVGTERFEVVASVPAAVLPRLDVPHDGEPGARARVFSALDGVRHEWRAHLARVLPDVEEGSSLARVALVVPDPQGLDRPEGPRALPLLLGSFVEVEVDAVTFDEPPIRVPREALRGADQVWVEEEGALRIRDVEVVWQREESVLVRGVDHGASVVLGPLAAPVDGMRLRTRT